MVVTGGGATAVGRASIAEMTYDGEPCSRRRERVGTLGYGKGETKVGKGGWLTRTIDLGRRGREHRYQRKRKMAAGTDG